MIGPRVIPSRSPVIADAPSVVPSASEGSAPASTQRLSIWETGPSLRSGRQPAADKKGFPC